MGPGVKPSNERSLTDPPVFAPDCDILNWRKSVGQWVDMMKAAHDQGSDRTYKTLFKLLGRTLYQRGLPVDQQAMIDEAQKKGIINYLQTDDPVEAVRDIVNIVAVDPPIAMVSRLINSFQKVTSCRRRTDEDLRVFVSRFRGLASKHLLHANVPSSSQIGEVMAVTLLNNALLDDGTLINATSALITRAEARAEQDKEDRMQEVHKASFKKVEEQINKLATFEKNRVIAPQRDADEHLKSLRDFRSHCILLIRQLSEALEALNTKSNPSLPPSVSNLFLADQKHLRLNLDDAVLVLRNLTQTGPSQQASQMSQKQLKALVDRKVSAYLANYKSEMKSEPDGRPGPSDRNNKPNSQRSQPNQGSSHNHNFQKRSRKRTAPEEIVCYDCGEKGHYRGSDDCKSPSYLTKKHKENAKRRKSSEDSKKDQGSSFFRPRSGSK